MRTRSILVIGAFVVLVGGCTGGTTPAAASGPSAPPGLPSALSASANTTGGAPSAGSSAAAPANAAVTVQNFAFQPGQLTISVGTTVTWTNQDTTNHQIALDDGSFMGQPFGQGSTTTHAFSAAGSIGYHCQIHPSMKGTIVVH